jgi:hypothetical protein
MPAPVEGNLAPAAEPAMKRISPSVPLSWSGPSDADRAAAAAAAGAARSASASSAAAGQAGQKAEQASAAAVAKASDQAAKGAGATPQAQPTPQDDLLQVRQVFEQLMNTQDDPVLRRQWNQMLISRGLENQATMDALKMAINQDPALRGQPAGDALLQEFVRDSAFSLDQARGQLSIESANRLRELNQYGAENFLRLAQYRLERQDNQRRELLTAGDFDGYARAFREQTGLEVDVSSLKSLSPSTTQAVDSLSQAMVRNIESGNMDGARRNFEAIKALAPTLYGQLTFEDAVSGKDAYLLQSEARQGVAAMVRTQVAQGDIRGALTGIEQLLPDQAARVRAGSQLASSRSLEDINRDLQAAGMTAVSDPADLIGREEDVWKATELAKLQGAAGKTVVDDTVNFLAGTLKDQGYNITDPVAMRALRAYALDLQLSGGVKFGPDGKPQFDPNSVIPPWKPESTTSHLFTDWPVLGADGKTVNKGWEPYGEANARPAPDTALGRYYEDLDGKWEDYLLKTPAAGRLTREQWFHATQAGTADPDQSKIPGGLAPGKPSTDVLDIEEILGDVRTGKMPDAAGVEALKRSGRLTTYTIENLATAGGSKAGAEKLVNGDSAGLVLVGDKLVRVLPDGGEYFHHFYTSGLVERSRNYSWVKVEVDGKAYKVDNRGNWYAGDAALPKSYREERPPTVPNPLEKGAA